MDVEVSPTHGDFSPRNLILKESEKRFELGVIDWSSFRKRNRHYDLHYISLNILSWSCMFGASKAKARGMGQLIEAGYFGGEPVRGDQYWITRAVHLADIARLSRILRTPFGQGMLGRRWMRIVTEELDRCIANLSARGSRFSLR